MSDKSWIFSKQMHLKISESCYIFISKIIDLIKLKISLSILISDNYYTVNP